MKLHVPRIAVWVTLEKSRLILLLLISLLFSGQLISQTTYGTAYIDVNPGATGSASQYLEADINENYIYLRSESSSATGRELHRGYYSQSTITLRRDNYTGTPNGDPEYITQFGAQVWYAADEATGTPVVFRQGTGTPRQYESGANLFTECGSQLWYEGYNTTYGRELYHCGSSGVSQVVDLSPGTANSNILAIHNLDDTRIIAVIQPFGASTSEQQLIVTDGTTTTVLLEEGVGGVTSIDYDEIVGLPTAGHQKAYIAVSTSAAGRELWRTDGTIAGTVMVDDLNPGTAGSTPTQMVYHANRVYFSGVGADGDREPYAYENLGDNMILLANLNGTSNGSPEFYSHGGTVYFMAHGTNSTTWDLYSVTATTITLITNFGNTMTAFKWIATDDNNNTYFQVSNFVSGLTELWVTKGSTASTMKIRDVGDIQEGHELKNRTYYIDNYTPDGIGEEVYVVYECELTVSASVTDVSCPGSTDGALNISVGNDFEEGSTYDWDIDGTGDFNDAEDLTGLAAGDYVITVRDGGGCESAPTTFTVGVVPDVTAPIADNATLTDASDECAVTLAAPTATDNCSGAITGTPDVSFPVTAEGTTVVTWTYDDGNGNTSTQSQNIIIDDITAPVANNATLPDLTDECSVMPIAPTATDNCAGTITGSPDVSFPITNQGTTVITWTYDDGRGNTTTQTQNVIINDVTLPVADLASLPDLTDECSINPAAPTASDNCVGTINGIPDVSFPITTQGTTVITWTYEDDNGNLITQTQNAIIGDVTAPAPDLATLPDATGECTVVLTPPTATDNCVGAVTATTTDPTTYNVQGSYSVTWTYDDGHGNLSTQTQDVIIDDISAPIADNATLADVTDECEVTAVTAPTATDACFGAFTGTPDVSFPITAQGTTVITWTYDDGQGNTSTQTQNVIITDVSAPVADNASLSDVTDECSVNSVTAPTATDACVGGTVSGTPDITFPITAQGTTVITWTYDDGLGNTSTQTQNVIIDDVTAPVVDNATLSDLTDECSVTPVAPTATDACVGALNGTPDVAFPITTQGTTVVTWTYDDGNGNTTTQTQNVIITDVTAPVADNASLPDLTDECSVTPSAPTATDNCIGAVTGVPDVSFPITNQGTTVVTWTYTDAGGNTSQQTQNVIITDVTAPVADNATLSDLTDECSVTPAAPTATDNCVGTVTATPDLSFPITDQGTTVLTWTYDDGNGNTSTQTQNIIIDDVTAPVVSDCPADIVIEANASGCQAIVTWTDPTAMDNCVGLVSPSTTHNSGDTFPIGTTLVTFTFDDGNGNESTCEFNVTVENNMTLFANNSFVSCFGANDGNIDITVSGGTAPHSYDWNAGTFNSEDLTDLGPGTYEVVATDANGCTTTNSYDIEEPTAVELSINTITDPTSCGLNDGTADVTATGGNVSVDYTYFWTDLIGYTSMSQNPSDLGAGTYYVTVSDDNGCSVEDTIVMTDPNAPILAVDSTNSILEVLCFGELTGSIDLGVTLQGGASSSTIDWDNDGLGDADDTEDLNNLAAGTYLVKVVDENNCTSTLSVEITQPAAALDLSESNTDEILGGDGSIDLTVTGGTQPYQYDWSNAGTSEDLSGLVAGTYTVIVTDDNGCTETMEITINSQVSIDEDQMMVLSAYPNPTNGNVWIQLSETEPEVKVRVYAGSGELISEEIIYNSDRIELVIDGADGLYFVEVSSSGGAMNTLRIIKN